MTSDPKPSYLARKARRSAGVSKSHDLILPEGYLAIRDAARKMQPPWSKDEISAADGGGYLLRAYFDSMGRAGPHYSPERALSAVEHEDFGWVRLRRAVCRGYVRGFAFTAYAEINEVENSAWAGEAGSEAVSNEEISFKVGGEIISGFPIFLETDVDDFVAGRPRSAHPQPPSESGTPDPFDTRQTPDVPGFSPASRMPVGQVSPYLEFMLERAAALGLLNGKKLTKEAVEADLLQTWPTAVLGSATANKISNMATFMRWPEHARGGHYVGDVPAPSKKNWSTT